MPSDVHVVYVKLRFVLDCESDATVKRRDDGSRR